MVWTDVMWSLHGEVSDSFFFFFFSLLKEVSAWGGVCLSFFLLKRSLHGEVSVSLLVL